LKPETRTLEDYGDGIWKMPMTQDRDEPRSVKGEVSTTTTGDADPAGRLYRQIPQWCGSLEVGCRTSDLGIDDARLHFYNIAIARSCTHLGTYRSKVRRFSIPSVDTVPAIFTMTAQAFGGPSKEEPIPPKTIFGRPEFPGSWISGTLDELDTHVHVATRGVGPNVFGSQAAPIFAQLYIFPGSTVYRTGKWEAAHLSISVANSFTSQLFGTSEIRPLV
jgi:hypothetical protein